MAAHRRTGTIVRSDGNIFRYPTEDLSLFERDLKAAVLYEVTAYAALAKKDTLLELSLTFFRNGEYGHILGISDESTPPSRPRALLTITRLASALQKDLGAYIKHLRDYSDISKKEAARREEIYEQLKTELQKMQDRVAKGLETIVDHGDVM